MKAPQTGMIAVLFFIIITTGIAVGGSGGGSGFLANRIHDSVATGIPTVFPLAMGFLAAGLLLFRRHRIH